MTTPKITIEPDGLYCKADIELIASIAEILKFERKVSIPSQFGTKIVRKPAYFIDRRTGRFLSGLLERVSKQLAAQKIQCVLDVNAYSDSPPGPTVAPSLQGLTLRPDQVKLASSVRRFAQGVIVSPTGSGKTITALGIISQWPQAKTLILVHRRDIVKQFAERAAKHLPDVELQVISGGNQNLTGQIVCSTIQSIIKYPIKDIIDYFDITICDECHHVSDRKGMYGKFMSRNLSPIKIGFTATLPTDREKLLAMEGLLGPVIGELSLEESQNLGIIVKPFVTLVPIPFDLNIGELRKYRYIYTKGIVENRGRNARIIKAARSRAYKGKTSLIIITEVNHGSTLLSIAHKLGLNAEFVQGAAKSQDRDHIKAMLDKKDVDSVICTNVWKEGIDIPTVGAIILAGGGKSAIQLMQGVGRGLRTAEGKDSAEIIDFLDPYRYLAEHAVARISVYVEKGWL